MSSKTVISVRLSAETLARLDDACRLLKINRSQAIDKAVRLLPELVSGSAELQYHPENRRLGPAPRIEANTEDSKLGGAGES